MKESINVAVTGKGGTGKSTLSALLINHLYEIKKKIILAIDADPNYNLDVKLGIEAKQTIGDMREEMRKAGDENPGGMSKAQFVEYQLKILLEEGDKFDLLTMGRQEGTGCYCYINNVLRHLIDTLSTNYQYIVIDNDAGMEHLSRRTDKHMDFLIIASDATKVGIMTAARIRDMAVEMELVHGKVILVVNNAPAPFPEFLDTMVKEHSFDNVYVIPYDAEVFDRNARGLPLLDVPRNSPANAMVGQIVMEYLS
jgi:CO dehydrogenase maturation factor